VTTADILISSVKVLAALATKVTAGTTKIETGGMAEATKLGWSNTEWACYKYPTSCSHLLNPPFPHITHTHCINILIPSSPWASALDRNMFSVLRSRVG